MDYFANMKIARALRGARIVILLGLAAPFLTFCNLPGGEDPCVLDQHCDGTVAFSCREDIAEGHSSWNRYAEDCAASGRVCLEQGDRHVPICVLSKDPDPRCSAQTTYCAGNSEIFCEGGYASDSWDCPVCRVTAVGTACFGLDGQEIHEKPPARGHDGG